ncbi:MAG: hypothetical protein FJ009_06190 [Chloroflexi bacterium]|nr:hypothetical protein [Chloroflexota bacterium]
MSQQTVNWGGRQIPVLGTLDANDRTTYVIETGGNVIAWTDGEEWGGWTTTKLRVTPFRTADEARDRMSAIAKDQWHINKDGALICSNADLNLAIQYAKLKETMKQLEGR